MPSVHAIFQVVADFLSTVGLPQNATSLLAKVGVDGAVLLDMTETDALNFGLEVRCCGVHVCCVVGVLCVPVGATGSVCVYMCVSVLVCGLPGDALCGLASYHILCVFLSLLVVFVLLSRLAAVFGCGLLTLLRGRRIRWPVS